MKNFWKNGFEIDFENKTEEEKNLSKQLRIRNSKNEFENSNLKIIERKKENILNKVLNIPLLLIFSANFHFHQFSKHSQMLLQHQHSFQV